jgi:outer membrane immunogenic protein
VKPVARVIIGAIAGLALGAAVLPAPASAADMPLAMPYAPVRPPLYDWTACYGGFNIGGGASNKQFTDINEEFTLIGNDLGSHTAKGVVGGGQFGCDYQAGMFVFGGQALFDASGMKGANFLPNQIFIPVPLPNGTAVTANNNTFVQWFATLTARAGVLAAPTLLFYAKAGGAWAHDVYNVQVFNGGFVGQNLALGSATPSGWTAGLGLEWAFFSGNFTAFAEWDYASFGTSHVNYTGANLIPPIVIPIDVKQSMNLFLFGINYRFGVAGRAY